MVSDDWLLSISSNSKLNPSTDEEALNWISLSLSLYEITISNEISSLASWFEMDAKIGASLTSVIDIDIVPSSDSDSLLLGFITLYLISSLPEKLELGL